MLVVLAFISYNKILQFNKSVDAVMRTNEVKNRIIEVGSILKDAEIGQRGYLLSDDSVFLEPFNGAEKRSYRVFTTLYSLISDNPGQLENLKKLKTLVDERYFLLNKNLKLLKNNHPNSFTDSALLKGKIKMDEIRRQAGRMLEMEDKLLKERTQVKDRTASITPNFLLILSLFSIGVITVFFFRLQKETALRISTQEGSVELEAANKIIKEQLEYDEKLMTNMGEGLYTIDEKGVVIYMNPAAENIFGYTLDELVGKKMHAMTHYAHRDGSHFPDYECAGFQVLHTGKSLHNYQDVFIKKDGTFFDVQYSSAPIIKDEQISGLIVVFNDITQRKLTEQKLKEFTEELERKVKERTAELTERNRFIETLIDSSIDSIIVYDKELRFLSMNKVAIQSYEKHFSEGYVGKKMDEVIPQVHQTGVYANALKALNGNINSQKEYNTLFEEKYYDIDFIPLKNEREVYGVMVITREVTESVLAALAIKKANAELQIRKDFVEAILETSQEYIAVYANDFTLLSLNKAAESMLGKKRDDVIGKKLLEIMPGAKGTKAETDLQRAFDGNIIQNEAYQSTANGRFIENYINPLKDQEGNIYGALAIANDVTNLVLKQKEIENANYLLQLQNQTFELAESIAKFGSYKWNITTQVMEYSDNLFRILDCEPQEFIPSFENFISFIHPDDLPQVIENGEQTMKSGLLVETPYRIITKTGVIKYLRSSGTFSGEGDNRILIGTVQDISNDVAATKELKTKNIELENANAELSSFSYVASHDLQEPLRKIQGFSKRILDKDGENLSETTKDYFNRIHLAAQRMQNLIESLLSFSRTNLNKVVFEKTDLNETLREVQAVLNELITQKNAVIESQTLPILNSVPIQMHQLFLNLIGNSLKYSKPDIAPLIKITTEKVTINEVTGQIKQKGDFWKIAISDNGIGFEQEYESKIFELFQRLHSKTEYEGTGIGLAICKKIVQAHNGTITATGLPNVGSTFTFFLSDNNIS